MRKLGWHIVRSDRVLRYNDSRQARVGVRLAYKRREGADEDGRPWRLQGPRICYQGMHASPSFYSARACWKSLRIGQAIDNDWLCRVLVEGVGEGPRYHRRGEWDTKFVGTHRTVLGMIRIKDLLTYQDERLIIKQMQKRNNRNGTRVKVR